ncbi:MAG: hypothetical protein N3B68_05760 [Anaerolineae bacterium]|nr:hypothetical protein [Anaerolineae bacterium]
MDGTVGELLDLTLRAEREALKFYEELARRFAHVPRVTSFWQEMAEDEREHIRLVELAASGLTPEQLAEPTDSRMLHMARNAILFSAQAALDRIQNLNDAYEAASDLEYGEVNVVFQFIVLHYLDDKIREQLAEHYAERHLRRLRLLGSIGGLEYRENIPAQE